MQSWLHIPTLNHWYKNPDDSRYMSLIKSSTGSNWMGTTLGRAWPVTGWETTRPPLFKGIRYPIIVKGGAAPCFLFLFFSFIIIKELLYPTMTNLDQIESYDLWIKCWQILCPIGCFFSPYFRYFTWYRDEVWIKLNLMTQDFHVDRCCAHWPLFSVLVISFDRGIELGSNWNSWPMNLMLTDFTPNWALFLF